MRTAEGDAATPARRTNGVVGSAAPRGVTVTDGEVTLARLLRLGSGGEGAARQLPVATRVLVVAMLGVVIALVGFALGGLF
jgi:hypothetical protein